MKLEADLNCPNCGGKFKQRIEDMRPGRSRVCPHCSARIQFTGDDGRKAQKAIDDLEKELKKLSRGFKFRP
jgi:DNA-directed RNA polymerase subunit RPC12/RpoP